MQRCLRVPRDQPRGIIFTLVIGAANRAAHTSELVGQGLGVVQGGDRKRVKVVGQWRARDPTIIKPIDEERPYLFVAAHEKLWQNCYPAVHPVYICIAGD